jgi:hypothetical protein
MLLAACALASPATVRTAAAAVLDDRERLATASKYNEFGQHFMENCTGFECLSMYVNHEDGMYSWEDLNVTISGKDPLSHRTWTGSFCGWWLVVALRASSCLGFGACKEIKGTETKLAPEGLVTFSVVVDVAAATAFVFVVHAHKP